MKLFLQISRAISIVVTMGSVAMCIGAAAAEQSQAANEVCIVELQGRVEVSAANATTWTPAQTNQILHPFERLRTGPNSRAALRWSDQSVVAFDAATELEFLPAAAVDEQSGLHLVRGIISFFHRDKPGRLRVITHGAVAGVEGTEFVLAVNDTDRTALSVIDGRVRFSNEHGMLVLTNGQQALAELGSAPVRTAGFNANNLLQWCFYYPAVLDPDELPLTADEQAALGESLASYRTGDLLAALAKFPADRTNGSDAERVYQAALLLSVGQAGAAEAALNTLAATNADTRPQRLGNALRELIAAVKRQPHVSTYAPQLATELLAASYQEQSQATPEASLSRALALAKQAAARSPQSGFAWARVAELEFSFGRTDEALAALDKSLALAPRNAQALALKGFLLAAQNKTGEAMTWFNRAIAVDAALGNAWLGRGLCRIRNGEAQAGREDLLVAAALEPQRAELRSYLAKAYVNAGDYPHATRELELAKRLDPNDPTAWLYSALVNQQNNRINDAIRNLEKSEALNANRSVYRSQFLLDQDQAVRGANLAGVYRDAGMNEVSVQEAARAVNYDYANYSAHLFLANSYQQLLDQNGISLRYETPTANEYLLANLLSPAAAGTLSPTVSQQEYSKLFEHDHFGVASDTEYLSRGAWRESGAQYGTFGDFSYDLEANYRTDPGEHANTDIEQRLLTLTLKQQVTRQDMVFAQIGNYDANGGDEHQYYDPGMASRDFRFKETQEPTVLLGYHHEWNPGVHTLALFTRAQDTTSFTNLTQPTIVAFRPDIDPDNMPGITHLTGVTAITMREGFENRLIVYAGEMQQIWQTPEHNTVMGARLQYGEAETLNVQYHPSDIYSVFPKSPTNAAEQDLFTHFYRVTLYGYHQWQILEPLQLVAGLSYDWLEYPGNILMAPISDRELNAGQLSPKAGIIWTPAKDTVVRFAYTRSLADSSIGQSYQLEPSQVAGFTQSYRSIIPESVASESPGARVETYGLSVEQKFSTGTYLGLYAGILNSRVRRMDGAFDVLPDLYDFAVPSSLRENLDYQEKTLQFTVNQLAGRDWALGAQYRISQAVLNDNYPEVANNLLLYNFNPRSRNESVLQQLNLFAIYNHPSGFFTKGEAVWNGQSNEGYTPGLAGDEFWQFNVFAGWRFLHRRAEVRLGVLNLTGQDYHLSPLNFHAESPHTRTFTARLQLNF